MTAKRRESGANFHAGHLGPEPAAALQENSRSLPTGSELAENTRRLSLTSQKGLSASGMTPGTTHAVVQTGTQAEACATGLR